MESQGSIEDEAGNLTDWEKKGFSRVYYDVGPATCWIARLWGFVVDQLVNKFSFTTRS